jgi:hypothetical protein
MERCLNDPSIENKMTALIIDSSTNKAMFYMYRALKELQFEIKVLSSIERALRDYESIKYRPYFLYLEHAINDREITLPNKEKILEVIERAYRHNEKYFLESDSMHQWILRVAISLLSYAT